MKKHILKVLSLAAIFTLSFTNAWALDYVNGTPSVTNITQNAATIQIEVDESVSLLRSYYVVLEYGEAAPSLEEVFDGFSHATEKEYFFRGNISYSNGFSVTGEIEGLVDGTDYVLYVYTRKANNPAISIEQTVPTAINFSTLEAPDPLQYIEGFPDIINISEDEITFEIQVNQFLPGVFSYYVVLESEEVPPTLTELTNGYRSGTFQPFTVWGNVAYQDSSTTVSKTVGGLVDGTDYVLYVYTMNVGDPRNSIEKTVPTAINFSTLEVPVPPYVVEGGYFPASGAIEVPISGELRLELNEPVKLGADHELFLIYSEGGLIKTFAIGVQNVSISEDGYELIVDLSSSPLSYETEYYVVIEEGFVRSATTDAPFAGIDTVSGSISSQVWYFRTESRPPLWQEGYPKLSNMSDSGFTLEVHADIPGMVYGVITMSSEAPAPDSIAASKNHYGDPAIMSINEVVESTIDPTIVNVEFADNDDVFYLHVVYRRSISGELSKYGEVRTLVIDRRAPRVTDTYPTDGCLAFPVDGKIVVNFSERVQDINGNSLSVDDFVLHMMDGEGYSEVEFSVINSVVNERTSVTITPDTILTGLSTYKLIIPHVKDLSGNLSAKVDTVNFETDGLFTWTGDGEDANWLNVNNWGGVLPGAGKSVLISDGAGNYPTISEGVIAVNNLTIESGASLTHTGGTLNVTGKLLLQSDTDGNASYIKTGGTLNVDGDSVRVEQYFGNPILTFLISSPTKGTSAANFGGHYPLSVYDNKTDTWPNVGIQETMSPGIGYRMWTLDNLVYFSGQLNSESITVDLTRTNGKGYGWNLVGNPYPAGLDWTLLDVDENSKIEDSFWLWMPKDKKYGAYSVATDIPINIESSVIPSNHAFLVKVKLGEPQGSITFKPTAQVPSQGNYLKSAKVSSVPYVKFAGLAGAVKDEIAVAFVEDASFAYDKYDLEKRFANQQSVFELYTNAGSTQAAINAIPLNGTYTLPLGYNALKSGNFGVEMVSDYTDNISCVLIDKELGVERLMRRGDKYEFTVNKAEKNISRFELKFTNIITSNKPINQSQFDFELFSKDQGIYINYNPSDVTMNFEIIDIYGRALGAGVLSGNHNVLLGVFDKGVYIVRITDETGRVSESRKVAVY